MTKKALNLLNDVQCNHKADLRSIVGREYETNFQNVNINFKGLCINVIWGFLL